MSMAAGHRGAAAVVDGGLGRGGGQLDGRHRPIAGVVDALGRLPDTDDDGRARIKIHSSTIYLRAVPNPNSGLPARLRLAVFLRIRCALCVAA